MHKLVQGFPSTEQAIGESVAAMVASVVALTMTTQEMGLALTTIISLLGVVVWLVRLEGRVNTQQEILSRVDTRVEAIFLSNMAASGKNHKEE